MAIGLLAMVAGAATAMPQASADHFLVVFESDPLPESLDLRHAHGVVTTRPQIDDRSRLIAEIPRTAMARDGSITLRPETRLRQMTAWRIYVLPGWTEGVLSGTAQTWLRRHSLCFREGSGALPERLTLDRYPPVTVDFEEGRVSSMMVSDEQLLGSEGSGFSIGDTFVPLEGVSEGGFGTARLIYHDPDAPRNTLEVVATVTEADRTRFDCTYTVEQPRDESVPVHLTLRPQTALQDMRGYTWREFGAAEHTTTTLPGRGQVGAQEFANLAQTPFVRITSAGGPWLGVLDHDQSNVVVSAGRDENGQQFVRVSTYLWPREQQRSYRWTFELIGGWTGDYNALLQALAPHTGDFTEQYPGAMVNQDRIGDLDAARAQGARVLRHDRWFHRSGAYFDSARPFDELYQTPWGTSFSYERLRSDVIAASDAEIIPHLSVQFAGVSTDIADRFPDSIVRDPDGEMIVVGTDAAVETVWTNPDPRGGWGASILRQVDGLLETTEVAGIVLKHTDRLDSAFEFDGYDYADFNGYSSVLAHNGARQPVSSVTVAGREWVGQLRAILDRHDAGLIAGSPTTLRVVGLSDGVLIEEPLTPSSLLFMKALTNGKSLYLHDTRDEISSPSDEPLLARLVQARPHLAAGASFSEPERIGRLLYAVSEGAEYPTLWYFDNGHTRMQYDPAARTVPAMYSGSRFEALGEQPHEPAIARGDAARRATAVREDRATPGERFANLPRFGVQVFGIDRRRTDEPEERPERPERREAEVDFDVTATEGVPPTYVLGPGDELAVRVWTDRIQHVSATPTVDAEGNVYLELVGAVNVAGETISEVRTDLSRRYAQFFDRAQVTVGLARTRVIEVRVTGDVAHPGKYRLGGAVTVFSALHAAGGPSEIGSLRRIRLIRGDQPPVEIDLYDYLLEGDPRGDLPLGPEDTVFVAPAGPTVGITGQIQRPARYELSEGTTLPELIAMAGGLAAAAHTRGVQVWRADGAGERQLLNVDLAEAQRERFTVLGGDLVVIPSILEESLNTIEIAGPVRRPGTYQHREGLTVSGLLREAQGLTTDAHVQEAYLRRLNEDLNYETTSVDLRAALRGAPGDDLALQPGDRVIVLSRHEVEAPALVSIEGAVRNPRDTAWNRGMRISDLVKQAGGLVEGAHTPRANLLRIGPDQRRQLIPVDLGAAIAGDREANVELERGDLLRVMRRSEVAEASEVHVTGLVQEEGWYARPQGMRVSDAILAAGGLTATAGTEVQYTPGGVIGHVEPVYLLMQRDADGFRIEPDPVVRDNDLIAVLGSGDFIPSAGAVTIQGRVSRPGSYALQSTADDLDTVYSLIQRAGGLLPNANPNGIVLYRLREEIIAGEQQDDLRQMIAHFNRELSDVTVEGEQRRAAGTAAQISAGLQAALSEGVATVVVPPRQLSETRWARAVPIDGVALIESAGEREDFPLSDGDVIVVPETPTTVTVMGAVVRPGAVPYRAELKTADFIARAGDFTPDARKRQTVVIRANGEVTPNAMNADIRPGDIILVPSDYIFRDVGRPATFERVLNAVTAIIGGYLIFR